MNHGPNPCLADTAALRQAGLAFALYCGVTYGPDAFLCERGIVTLFAALEAFSLCARAVVCPPSKKVGTPPCIMAVATFQALRMSPAPMTLACC